MGPINKMLISIDGKSMLQSVIDQILGSRINRIIVVLGHEQTEVRKIIPTSSDRIEVIENQNYPMGMASSIVKGVENTKNPEGVMICLGDMPFITSSEYDQIADALEDPDQIVIPRFRKINGNPVLFGSKYLSDLRALELIDQGAKHIIQRNHKNLIFVDMQTDHILKDIDQLPHSEQ